MGTDKPIKPYVLVIGAAGIDSKGRARVPLTPGSSTPGDVRVSVGGVARNVADNLARLGVAAVLVSAIGAGGSGRRILGNAAEVGINTDYLIISEEYRTSAYLAVLDEVGNLVMSIDDMQVMACLTPQVINQQHDLIKEAEMVFLDSNLSTEAIAALFKITSRYQVRVCADSTSKALAYKLQPYLPQIYMITPNLAEAEILSGHTIDNEEEAIAAARKLVNAGVKIAVITLREAGVVYASTNESGHIPALSTEVIDPTGASHALTATVIFGLLNDISLDEAVRLAASAAALTLACSDTVCVDLSLDLLYDHLVI
jgi:pseudouridine kinase